MALARGQEGISEVGLRLTENADAWDGAHPPGSSHRRV